MRVDTNTRNHMAAVGKIYVNGREQKAVLMADDKAGVVKRCRLDANDKILCTPSGDFEYVFVHGKVRIEVKPGWVYVDGAFYMTPVESKLVKNATFGRLAVPGEWIADDPPTIKVEFHEPPPPSNRDRDLAEKILADKLMQKREVPPNPHLPPEYKATLERLTAVRLAAKEQAVAPKPEPILIDLAKERGEE